MANYNKVILMGNLTRDPQLSYTANNTAITKFGLAVNRRWRGPDGQQKEETMFVDCDVSASRPRRLANTWPRGVPS